MRKNTFIFLTISILSLSFHAQAQNEEDRKAIKSMCGCFEVIFNFAETFAADTAYQFHENYQSKALEWVELVEDSDNRIVLQHLLLVGNKEKSRIVKHWRQDWLYENRNLYVYAPGNTWQFVQLPAEKVAGQWTQKVYQVDDSPRYEGSSTWVHVDGRHYWENTTDAPLPRREYTKRKDYNMMQRRNRHEITDYGWLHEQDNEKIVRGEKGDVVLAGEKGWNTYRKVADDRCQQARDWWKENKELWANVRRKWDEAFSENKTIKLADKVEGKRLNQYLVTVTDQTDQEEIDRIIDLFIEE